VTILLATVNWHTFFFMLFALLACLFALGVLFSNNIVRMAFYLVVSLGALAGLQFLAGAHFVGAMQVMIYVGGTMVLLVFGVMLTAHAAFTEMKTRSGDWLLSIGLGIALLVLLVQTALRVETWQSPQISQEKVSPADAHTTTQIGLGLAGVRADRLDEDDPVRAAGMSGYLLAFELIAIHLLVVLVGAAFMARPRRLPRRDEVPRNEDERHDLTT